MSVWEQLQNRDSAAITSLERRKNSVPEPDPYWMSPKEVEDLLKILEKENYNEAVRQEQSGI